MTRGVVAALVLALLVAGCGQFGPLGSPATETATQVPLDGAGDGQTGIEESRVRPTVLASTHATVLAGTSYTMRVEQRTEQTDGPVLRRTTEYREVGQGGDSYAGRVRYNTSVGVLQEFGTIDYWRNETHVATRFDSPLRQVQVGIWQTTVTGPIPTPSNGPTLRTLLVATDATTATEFTNGSTLLTGSTQFPRATFETPPRLTEVRNVTGQFLARDDGVITSWRLAYDATFGRETVRVVRHGRIETIGATTVDRPAWVANATALDAGGEALNGPRSAPPRTRTSQDTP
jgi:predicted small lipoprotein YifL